MRSVIFTQLRSGRTLRSFLFLAAFIISSAAFGQNSDAEEDLDALYGELDSIFANESIPADLFGLVDSLLAIDTARFSALSMRMGYVSNIVSAGRNFGFDQYGFSPAITYFHHTGFYAGVTASMSSEYDPGYYLTDLNIGYLHTFKDHWNIGASHDFYFYNDSLADHSFDKSAQLTAYYQLKWADVGVDYAFLYGHDQAHRITAHTNGLIKLKTSGLINSITFMPGASFQWGNATVFYLRQPRTAVADLYEIVTSHDFPALTFRNYRRLTYLLESDRRLAAAFFLRDKGYSNDQIASTINLYYDGQVQQNDTFGFINYCFSFPVSITSGRWNLLLNYTYNVPVALPGEDFEYPANGYFSAAISYAIYWENGKVVF